MPYNLDLVDTHQTMFNKVDDSSAVKVEVVGSWTIRNDKFGRAIKHYKLEFIFLLE